MGIKLNPDKLRNHIAYLQDELSALENVISVVPYNEKPLGQPSINEILLMIDHHQINHCIPAVKYIFSELGLFGGNKENFCDTFLSSQKKFAADDVIDIISSTIKNRLILLDLLDKIPVEDWARKSLFKGRNISIEDTLQEMLFFERSRFKEIADRIININAHH